MAERPHENISKRLVEKITTYKNANTNWSSIPPPKEFATNLQSLLQHIAAQVDQDVGSTANIKNVNTTQNLRHHEALKRIKEDFQTLYGAYFTLQSESDAINRIEEQASRRALFYRVATTLLVGASIMGIYALAHYLEIPMPLMRMPVT